jgi:hypothetical protein
MSKVVVYSRADGRVSVVRLPDEARDVVLLDAAAVPADRAGRDAWRLVDGQIVVPPPPKSGEG